MFLSYDRLGIKPMPGFETIEMRETEILSMS